MSDETNIIVIRRKVMRTDRLYYVYEKVSISAWLKCSKGYKHSTSAYAKLGRLFNEQVKIVEHEAK